MNRLLSQLLIFLIIDFKILGHVEKKNFFPENTIFKGIIFWYFQTATCYNPSLVLSRLDPALVRAACNIAVLNLTETLWFPFMLCYWCWSIWARIEAAENLIQFRLIAYALVVIFYTLVILFPSWQHSNFMLENFESTCKWGFIFYSHSLEHGLTY